VVRAAAKFPTFDSVTYTQQSTQGPTEIVEGYYEGDVKAAHDEVKAAVERRVHRPLRRARGA
jgi:hypothetical protein